MNPAEPSPARTPVETILRFLSSPLFLIGLGILLRAALYAANRSLWVDESALALNIIRKSYGELLKPLDFDQAAPVGFLFLEKFVSLRLGIGEYSLRLVPFLSGVASLPAFHALSRRSLPKDAVPWALFLFAIAGPLVCYSAEMKQYSSDVLVALLIFLAGFRAWDAGLSPRSVAVFAAAGTIGVWCSHPAIFVAGGVALALLAASGIRKEWGGAGLAVLAGLSFLLSFGAEYSSLLRIIPKAHFKEFWSSGFLPFPPSSLWHLAQYFDAFIAFFHFLMGTTFTGLGAFAFLCGAASMGSRKRDALLIFAFPVLLVAAASALRQYPLRGRLILFLAPVVAVFAAEGILKLRDISRAGRFPAAAFLVALLFLQPLQGTVVSLRYPEEAGAPQFHPAEEMRPVLRYIQGNWRRGDAICVYYAAEEAFRYYSILLKADFQDSVFMADHRKDPGKYREGFARFRGRDRVWVLFSHVEKGWMGTDEEEYLVDYLDTIGKRLDRITERGSSAYLYAFPEASGGAGGGR